VSALSEPVLPAEVVDASVATKWLLRDEANVAQADELLERCYTRKLLLVSPQQIDVEVAAALRRAALNGRISHSTAEQLLYEWLNEIHPRLYIAPNAPFLPLALARALALGITLFDALYVVIAEEAGISLVVADDRLLKSPAGRLPFIRSLGSSGSSPD
jgi:predicted nucleic acid-binding protein